MPTVKLSNNLETGIRDITQDLKEDIKKNTLDIDVNKEKIDALFKNAENTKNEIRDINNDITKCQAQIGANTDEINSLISRMDMVMAKNEVLYKMTTAQWFCIGALTIISIILALF